MYKYCKIFYFMSLATLRRKKKKYLKWKLSQNLMKIKVPFHEKPLPLYDPKQIPSLIPYGLFGSLEREESRREQKRGEQWGGEQRGMIILHLVWMSSKLVRGNGVISHSLCLDVLKIRMERRGNDLNKQIYPYLKIDLQQISKEKV